MFLLLVGLVVSVKNIVLDQMESLREKKRIKNGLKSNEVNVRVCKRCISLSHFVELMHSK